MRESIDSVRAQTYENWELLIVDDASTDRTASIAHEYEKMDLRIHYYRNPQNMGLPKTLNQGFSLSCGAYLTWTSDDNYYYPTALEVMCRVLQRENKDFVFASYDVINANGTIIRCTWANDLFRKMIVGCNPVGACFLYSRKVYETIGDYDPALALVEDFDYWQRAFLKFELVCIHDKLYAYRQHDGTLTNTMKRETFYWTLEQCLLKNRPGFGKLDCVSSYFFYQALYNCRKELGSDKNPYLIKYQFYRFFSCGARILSKGTRILSKLRETGE